ncbi:MAG: hypothetical protein AAAB35_01980 [Phyllobacterium sp.]|uniref:hypothetical protein n=1 Tax=Phyllobacterium sp. TaxID=1871046 RepID=UPI0030F32421
MAAPQSPANTPLTINVESGTTVAGSGIEIAVSGDSTSTNDGALRGSTNSVRFLNGVAGFTKTLDNNGSNDSGIVGSGDGTIITNQNGVINSGGMAENLFQGRLSLVQVVVSGTPRKLRLRPFKNQS